MIVIRSPRLQLSQFQIRDAREVFGCITPAEAWNGLTKSHNEPLWFEAWDGVLAGDYYPP